MGNLLLISVLAATCFLAIQVWVLRWVFRVNRILATLESIDRSLQYLPAVREGKARLARVRKA